MKLSSFYHILFISLNVSTFVNSLLAQNDNSEKKREMFGIQLSKEATKLLLEVEHAYGKKVKEDVASNWESTVRIGQCYLTSDGVPTIQVNSNNGINEGTIVHELFHLKQKAEGVPIIAWKTPTKGTTVSNEYLTWLRGYVMDLIAHHEFYPKMRAMGLNTTDIEKEQWTDFMDGNDYLQIPDEVIRKQTLTIYYLKLLAEENNRKLIKRVTRWYKANNLNSSLELGEELYEIINDSKFNAQTLISNFLKIINRLCEGQLKFELESWGTNLKGTFQENYVVINVRVKN